MGKIIKELSEDQIIKKDYSVLTEMNQRLKNICEIYYISHTGLIYLKSLVPFAEKVILLNDPDMIKTYRGAVCLPNKIFEFKKNAKKSKLVTLQTNNAVEHGQTDSDLSLRIDIAVRNEPEIVRQENSFIQSKIIPMYYTKYFTITSNIDTNSLTFTRLSDDDVNDIVSSKMVEVIDKDLYIPITKHLLLDVKAGDAVYYTKLPYSNRMEPTFIEGDPDKTYIMFKNVNQFYTAYTIIACSNHIMG